MRFKIIGPIADKLGIKRPEPPIASRLTLWDTFRCIIEMFQSIGKKRKKGVPNIPQVPPIPPVRTREKARRR